MSSPRGREYEDTDVARHPKRAKIEREQVVAPPPLTHGERHLPPSHALLGIPLPDSSGGVLPRLSEHDVGISEYIDRKIPGIEGVIKQRSYMLTVNHA